MARASRRRPASATASANASTTSATASTTAATLGAARAWHLWPSWALVLVVPLVVSPVAHENFRLPKALAASILALAALLFLLPRLAARRRPVSWREVASLPAFRVALPLVAAAALSVVAGPHPAHGVAALPPLAIALALLVGWSVGLGERERWRLLCATVVPAVLLALVAWVQYAVVNPFRFEGELRVRMGLTSLAGNPFDLAAFLILPAVVAQAQLAAPGGRRWPWALALATIVAGLAVSQTLTAQVAAVVATLAFWIPRLPRRRVVALLALLALAAGLAVAAVPPLRNRLALKVHNLQEGDLLNFLSGRLEGWQAALWMLGERPLTGVGHGAFRAEFGEAKLALVARGVGFARLEEPYFTAAHNDYLQAAAEWGWVGVAALAASMAIAGRGVLHAWRRSADPAEDPDARRRLGAMVAILLALGLLALVNFPWHLALVAYPGLLAASGLLRPTPAVGSAAVETS